LGQLTRSGNTGRPAVLSGGAGPNTALAQSSGPLGPGVGPIATTMRR